MARDGMTEIIQPGKLTTYDGVTKEMRAVYRQAKRGAISTSDMSRYIYALHTLLGAYRDKELIEKLDRIQLELDAARSQGNIRRIK